uniref:Uncharacterized protein n=1 Tax=Corethron hystrix TaxID=216773 RepID=A0A6U5F979_9STRA|mmetsp:Transcript_22162/g.50738  ORF Transcript_22162/g.50738 Transcript_22162/m.50738 type:complete len:726 (+) Transcript_22162:155-2332(+)
MGNEYSAPAEEKSDLNTLQNNHHEQCNKISSENGPESDIGESKNSHSDANELSIEPGMKNYSPDVGCCLTMTPGFGYDESNCGLVNCKDQEVTLQLSKSEEQMESTSLQKKTITAEPLIETHVHRSAVDDRQSENSSSMVELGREKSEIKVSDMSPKTVSNHAVQPGKITPIHVAICSGDPNKIEKEFISCCPDDLLKVDDKCLTPLNLACSINSQSELVEALVLINPKAAQYPDQYGTWPLHMATRYSDSEEAIRLLVSVFPEALLEKDDFGNTPLNISIKRNLPPNVIKFLLETNPQATIIPDEDGSFPLHNLRKSGHFFNLTKRLMMAAPEALMVQNKFGCTPLHVAIEANVPINVISLMVRVYPQAVMLKDARGFTPITVAWTMINKIMKSSTRNGTAEEREVAKRSLTAMLAGHGADDSLKKKMQKSWERMKLLLKAHHYEVVNAKIDEVKFRGTHAAAACCAPPQWIMYILWMDSESNNDRETDELGKTPLHYAASAPVFIYQKMPHGQMSTVEYLIRQFPESLVMKDNFGRVPLHWAIAAGKTWNTGIKTFVTACPSLLTVVDPYSRLYPFMMAVLGDSESDKKERETKLKWTAQNKFLWKETAWDLLTKKEKEVHLKKAQAEQELMYFNTAFEMLLLCPQLVSIGIPKVDKRKISRNYESRDDKLFSKNKSNRDNSLNEKLNSENMAVRAAVMAKLCKLRKVASLRRISTVSTDCNN